MTRRERPIVVCGPARSGTSAVMAMLNLHEDVLLAREVPLDRLPSLRSLLEETAGYQGESWTEERRAEVVRAFWYASSRPWRFQQRRRWGMKTPWSELDAELWDSLVNPLYVYALRRGDRVFRSHIELGWDDGRPANLIDRYKSSIRAFEGLRARGSAHIVQLDLVDDPNGRRRLAEGLYEFIGEAPAESTLERIASSSERLNSPTSRPGEEPDLPAEWRELLAADGEYQELMAAFGYRAEVGANQGDSR